MQVYIPVEHRGDFNVVLREVVQGELVLEPKVRDVATTVQVVLLAMAG